MNVAGLLPTGFHHKICEKDLLFEIERIWISLGRQPTTNDIRQGCSQYSLSTYTTKFGSWRNALETFVKWVNEENTNDSDSLDEDTHKNIVQNTRKPISNQSAHKTNREINLRLRFKVMKRDNFKCCLCGSSPAKDPFVELQIDHIKPWSKGGETTIENLRTLCSKCNLGKSDLYDE